jgi:hypothetical protein
LDLLLVNFLLCLCLNERVIGLGAKHWTLPKYSHLLLLLVDIALIDGTVVIGDTAKTAIHTLHHLARIHSLTFQSFGLKAHLFVVVVKGMVLNDFISHHILVTDVPTLLLDGFPWLRDWCSQSFLCYKEQVRVLFQIEAEEFSISNNLLLGWLIYSI